jgi:hypothetical protein
MSHHQSGGFRLDNDSQPTKLKSIVAKALQRMKPEIDLILQRTPQPGMTDSLLDKIATDPIYADTYDELFVKAMSIIKYDQIFNSHPTATDALFIRTDVVASHVSLCALLFICFMLEFEFFAVLYTIRPYYVPMLDKTMSTLVPGALADYGTATIKPSVGWMGYRIMPSSVDTLLDVFTKRLDELFYQCMNYIVNEFAKVTGLTFDATVDAFVPKGHHKHIYAYDYIYVDWMDRLRPTVDVLPLLIRYLKDYRKKIMRYVAEGTELFSSFYYDPGTSNFPTEGAFLIGSCMTETLFEFYILTRLHINPHSLNLYLQLLGKQEIRGTNPPQYMPEVPLFMYATYNVLQGQVSHWSTMVSDGGQQYHTRKYNPELSNITINFVAHREYFILAFVLPILDEHQKVLNSLYHLKTLMPESGITIPEEVKQKLIALMKFNNGTISNFNDLAHIPTNRRYQYPLP